MVRQSMTAIVGRSEAYQVLFKNHLETVAELEKVVNENGELRKEK